MLLLLFSIVGVYSQIHGDNWFSTSPDYEMSYVNDHTKSLTFDKINNLTVAWSYTIPIIPGTVWKASFDAHGSESYGNLFIADTLGMLYSFDIKTGSLNWNISLSTNTSDRGKTEQFQTTPVVYNNYVLISCRNIYAVNRKNGTLIWSSSISNDITSYGPDGRLTDYYTYTGDITVIDDYVIVGTGSTQNELTLSKLINQSDTTLTARGSVVAFNLSNGQEIWRFHTSPTPYGPGVSAWSSPSYDKTRDLVFIGTGQNFQGPVSPYSDSILAIRRKTGELVWSYQGEEGDIYNRFFPNGKADRDFATHPNLFTLNVKINIGSDDDDDDEVEKIDYVGIGSKDGKYYIFKRDQISINATPEVVLDMDFGSVIGGIQSTPVIKGDIMYIATHAVIDPFTGIRRGYNFSNPFDAAFFSTKVSAIDLVAAVENRTFNIWQYIEAPGLVKLADAPLSCTQNVLFQPSFAGYLNMFNIETGEKYGVPLIPAPNPVGIPVGYAIVGAVTIAHDRFCVPTGISFGSNQPGKLVCYSVN